MNSQSVSRFHALHPDINRVPYTYYRHVIRSLRPPKGVGVILVAHSYETVFALAKGVAELGTLRGIILKHSTSKRFPEIGQQLIDDGYPVLKVTKDQVIQKSNSVAQQIAEAVPGNERFVVMDHGGYFAFDSDLFLRFPASRLLGVAEHTLNGERRYRKLGITDRPIVSIGQSSIKAPSDEAAADAIVHASDYYLQAVGMNLNNPMLRIGIIGYGRLGNRIGQQLSSKNIRNVTVYDTDASKLAGMRGHGYADAPYICGRSDIIFCATGDYALRPEHYAQMRNNTVIFTVTSPDDELHLEEMISAGVLVPVREKWRGDTYVYRVAATGAEIFLPYNGESPNTSLPYGISDPVIHQTYAAHIAAAVSVMRRGSPLELPGGLQPLSHELEQTVSRLWIRKFGNPGNRSHGGAQRPTVRGAVNSNNTPSSDTEPSGNGGSNMGGPVRMAAAPA